MSDLISRADAINALRNAENHAFNSYYQGLIKAHKIIADLPSAQPEIIRCKDCKRGRETCGNIECDGEYHGYDWYCPNGKRKGNG